MPRTTSKKAPKARKPAAPATEEPRSDPVLTASTAGYEVGSKVTHPMFGDGTVTAFDANKLTIEFGDGRVKQILDAYVKRRA